MTMRTAGLVIVVLQVFSTRMIGTEGNIFSSIVHSWFPILYQITIKLEPVKSDWRLLKDFMSVYATWLCGLLCEPMYLTDYAVCSYAVPSMGTGLHGPLYGFTQICSYMAIQPDFWFCVVAWLALWIHVARQLTVCGHLHNYMVMWLHGPFCSCAGDTVTQLYGPSSAKLSAPHKVQNFSYHLLKLCKNLMKS